MRLEEWEWALRAVYKAGDLGTDEPAIVMGEAADRIEALGAENEWLREALKTAEAWLDRWARHIGDCPGIDDCACGLTRVRYEATTALAGDSHD